MNPPPSGEALGRALVALQFGLLFVLLLLAGWAMARGAGVPVDAWAAGLAGIALGAWALSANRPGNFRIRPTPHPQGRLVRHGPYRWLRHPMYSALLLGAFAVARVAGGGSAGLAWGAVPGWLAWLGLSAVLILKARVEERALSTRFADYADYQRHSWRFLPGLY